MAEPFGVTFQPGGEATYRRETGGTGSLTPTQEAIKVLSLRVPRVVGATPLAPLALLTSAGGGGLPAGLLDSLLRALVPASAAPPAASIPSATPTGGAALPVSSAPVPQPVTPSAPGVAPTMAAGPLQSLQGARPTAGMGGGAAVPVVRPQVTGAPSPQVASAYASPQSPTQMVDIPAPRISPITEPPAESPTVPMAPEQPAIPDPSLTARQELPVSELWELARALRSRMG